MAQTWATWPDGFYITRQFDAANRLTAIKENGSLTLARFTHDGLNRRTAANFGNTTSLDALQWGLTAAGLVPVLGEAFDLANAGVSAARGDWVVAGLNVASAIPFLGYGATTAKVGREVLEDAARAPKLLPDSALVCRGGTCTADKFSTGSGVTLDAGGRLQGVSVNSGAGKTIEELTSGIPNKQVGVTTVGNVRRAGGDLIPSPTANNPNHCTLCGITPQQAEQLMTPTIRNPHAR